MFNFTLTGGEAMPVLALLFRRWFRSLCKAIASPAVRPAPALAKPAADGLRLLGGENILDTGD